MIRGLTVVERAESAEEWARVGRLLSALGFEVGKGWSDEGGKGAAWLAPVGNIEVVTGKVPATARILVEVTQLDHVLDAVKRWADVEDRVDNVGKEQPWGARMFELRTKGGLELAFWQSERAEHGQVEAVEGMLSAEGMKFGVVTTRWNTVITDRLLQGALDCLKRSGARREDVEVVRVPGAWEVPNAARTLAESGRVDAVVTLGCLLRGETAHYEAIYNEVARGIGQSQQETGVPHAFGVLTCETLEQALDRAGLKAGNKGFEAASAAIEMVSIQRQLRGAK